MHQGITSRLPNIVFLDLETLPELKEVLKVYPSLGNYPGRTLKADITTIICFGYMQMNDKKAHCANAWDHKQSWKKNKNDDYHLVKLAHDMLQDADLIVTHNGKKFDMKFLNTRIMYHRYHGRKDKKLKPLPPIKHVDTIQLARRTFLLYSNALGNLGKFLNLGDKKDTGGWPLWVDVHNDCSKAKKKMTAYCKQDVQLLKKIFLELRALSKDIPNYNQFFKDEIKRCPNCGSVKVQNRGTRVQKDTIVQRYCCNHCGTWSKIKKNKQAPVI